MAKPNEQMNGCLRCFMFVSFIVQHRSFEPFDADDSCLKVKKWAHDERTANQPEIWMGEGE